MRKLLHSLLLYLAGLLSGVFTAQGLIVLSGRTNGDFGGEIFIIPLLLLLLLTGYQIGRAVADYKAYSKAWQAGYNEGRNTDENKQGVF